MNAATETPAALHRTLAPGEVVDGWMVMELALLELTAVDLASKTICRWQQRHLGPRSDVHGEYGWYPIIVGPPAAVAAHLQAESDRERRRSEGRQPPEGMEYAPGFGIVALGLTP